MIITNDNNELIMIIMIIIIMIIHTGYSLQWGSVGGGCSGWG